MLAKRDSELEKAARRFSARLQEYNQGRPSLFRLAIFRMTRSSMKHSTEALPADKKYYEENGWMESGYYYDVRLDPISSALGSIIDLMIKRMFTKASARAKQGSTN